jgi:cytochrome c553
MNYLPTLRKLSAVLVLAGAGVSINAMLGLAPAAGQGAAPAAAPAAAAATAAAPAEPTAGDPARGFRKAATCLGCHSVPGYKADFPTVYSVPMIGGQNAKYIENALKAYQKGERRFPSMIATAKSLSDQDIADVAAFFSSQH